MRLITAIAALLFVIASADPAVAAGDVYVGHGIAMHGDLKYGPDFQNFDYANPDAPKGGEVRFHSIGTYDSLNPFILKGVPGSGVNGFVFETLMVNSDDEAFSEYGLIAETIEVPEDRSWASMSRRSIRSA